MVAKVGAAKKQFFQMSCIRVNRFRRTSAPTRMRILPVCLFVMNVHAGGRERLSEGVGRSERERERGYVWMLFLIEKQHTISVKSSFYVIYITAKWSLSSWTTQNFVQKFRWRRINFWTFWYALVSFGKALFYVPRPWHFTVTLFPMVWLSHPLAFVW